MGMVHAFQKGELKDASPEVKKIAKSMDYDDAKHFAETKHKGLPEKVKKKKKKNKKNESFIVSFTNMVNESANDEDTNLKKLVKYFYEVCSFCDELNIYEWEEGDKSMQEMKAWVKKNYGHLK